MKGTLVAVFVFFMFLFAGYMIWTVPTPADRDTDAAVMEALKMYQNTPDGSQEEEEALKILLPLLKEELDTANNNLIDVSWVHRNAPKGSEVKEEAKKKLESLA